VLSAPFLGQLRAHLRAAFPGHFVTIVGASVALATAGAFAMALTRIRHARAIRYAVIAASVAVAIAYTLATRTGIPEVDVVEHVHFIEYGAIAFLFYRVFLPFGDLATFILPMLAGLIVGTCDEWLQWLIPNRVGEARDVFLNLIALACGLAFGAALEPPQSFRFRLDARSRRWSARTALILLLVFTWFFEAVHTGHFVVVPDIAAFKSHYTHRELDAMSRERAERWRRNPPLVLRRLSREDQYLDEGLWHVRERNEMWEAHDFDAAWRENEILERYFAPVLDTKTYAAPSLHRWPAEQKRDAEHRAARRQQLFVSGAEPYPIVTWSKTLLHIGLLVAMSLLGWIVRRSGDQERSS
jgi:VanZ family protein